MGLGVKVHTHKTKIKKETKNDIFKHMHNIVTPQCHRSNTSHFNVINKHGKKESKQGNVYSDKHTEGSNKSYKHK